MKNKSERSLSEERELQAKLILWVFCSTVTLGIGCTLYILHLAPYKIAGLCIATLGIEYILYIVLRFLLYEMAKRDALVTLRTDGEIKAIMRGDECKRYIMKVENYKIDPEGFDLFKGSFESYASFLVKTREIKLKEDPAFKDRKLKLDRDNGEPVIEKGHYQLNDDLKKKIEEANSSTLFEEIFGVVWVGFPPYRVFRYQFRWLKYGQKKTDPDKGTPSTEVGMFPREELVDSLYFRYPQYGVVLEDAETGAGERVGITDSGKEIVKVRIKRAEFVFETITVNPQKTLFRTAALSSAGDWQQALSREIRDRVRMWLGKTDWDTLVQNKKEVEKELLEIKSEINGVDADDLPLADAQISAVRDYGQKIVKITMPNIDLDPTLQSAYEAVFAAEKERDAKKARAMGERALAAAPIQGKADGLEQIGKIPGGKEMYMAEQLGKISVYAPGRDDMFLNVAAEVTGSPRKTK